LLQVTDRLYRAVQSVEATLSLGVISMVYLSRLNQIAAYVKGSHQLHFIWLTSPYPVRVHPLYFSDRVITSMSFHERTQTLVYAGAGLFFSRVVIPKHFKDVDPLPETIQFQRISESHLNFAFEVWNPPALVEKTGDVIVNLHAQICVHKIDGTLMRTVADISQSPLSCVSFNEAENLLAVGDCSGSLYIVGSPKCHRISDTKLLSCHLCDRDFVVAVDSSQSV
jgi:hypothetical protein